MQFLQSDLILVPHGMFSRHHGTSPPPFSSLNISFGVGDRPEHVKENRYLIKKILNIDFLLSAGQVHGSKIFTGSNITDDCEVKGYDALITDQPGVGLIIQQADCQALLIHDPTTNVIAAVHCGWRGNVADIIDLTIARMQEKFGVNPAHLHVVISPSLGPCCAEFVNFSEELPEHFYPYQEKANYFNFWEISIRQLIDTGVSRNNIAVTGICTCCNPEYFSYRRSVKKGQPATGRHASVICLPWPDR